LSGATGIRALVVVLYVAGAAALIAYRPVRHVEIKRLALVSMSPGGQPQQSGEGDREAARRPHARARALDPQLPAPA
jgi:hypothetical protein